MAIIIKDKNGNPTHVAGLGKQGPTGKSAYQYAVEAGFTGTESEFAARMDMYSNPNLLDNWYFPDPINQRGQTEYTGSGYCIDRWILTGSLKLNVSDGCIRITKTVLSNNPYFTQKFENTHYLVGKQLTVSFLYRTNITARFTANPTTSIQKTDMIPLSQDWTLYSFSFICGDIPDPFWIQFIASISDPENYFDIVAAKLELGPVQTLAHQDADGNWVLNDPPPNKALELAKCQRYQHILNIPNYRGLGPAQCYNDLWWYINVYTLVPLRATPTLSIDGPMAIINYDNTFHTTSDFQLHSYFNNIAVIRFKAEGTTADDLGASKHFDAWKGTGKILLDANL